MITNLLQAAPVCLLFLLGFTLCKAEQPLRGMELQEKEAQEGQRIQELCLEGNFS